LLDLVAHLSFLFLKITEESAISAAPEPPKPHHPKNRKPKRENPASHKENSTTVKNHVEINNQSDTVSAVNVNNSDIVGDTVPKSSKLKKPRSKKKPKQDKLATEKQEDLEKPLDSNDIKHADGIPQSASDLSRDAHQPHHTSTPKAKTKHHKKEPKKVSTSVPEANATDGEEHQSAVLPKDSADGVDQITIASETFNSKTSTTIPRFQSRSDKLDVNVVGESTIVGGSEEDAKKGSRTSKPSTSTKKKGPSHAAKETSEVEEIDYKDLDKMPTSSKHHALFKKAMHRDFVPKAKHDPNQASKAKQNSDSNDWRASKTLT
jgi:hypothetical protein